MVSKAGQNTITNLGLDEVLSLRLQSPPLIKGQKNYGDKATGSQIIEITRWRFSRANGTLIALMKMSARKSDRSADASEARSLASFSLPKQAETSKGV